MTRTVLVTGGNRGIGLEIVREFANQGYKVLMGCRDEEQGKEKLDDIALPDVHVVKLDLASQESIDEGFIKATAVFGDIDILVNNAGILVDKHGTQASAQEIEQSMQIHVYGPYALIQHALPTMKDNGFGRIINVSSGWGAFSEGLEGPLPYAVSKAALNALTVNLAATLSGDHKNVTINSVCPGWVNTRMGGKDAPKTPEQGADTVIWLGTMEDDCPNGQFFRERSSIDW